jgi:hypothetical protein
VALALTGFSVVKNLWRAITPLISRHVAFDTMETSLLKYATNMALLSNTTNGGIKVSYTTRGSGVYKR